MTSSVYSNLIQRLKYLYLNLKNIEKRKQVAKNKRKDTEAKKTNIKREKK